MTLKEEIFDVVVLFMMAVIAIYAIVSLDSIAHWAGWLCAFIWCLNYNIAKRMRD